MNKASRLWTLLFSVYWQMYRIFCNKIDVCFSPLSLLLALSLSEGKPFDPQYTLSNAVSNIICSMVFGHRFEYSNAAFRRILELDSEAVLLAGSARTQVIPNLSRMMGL